MPTRQQAGDHGIVMMTARMLCASVSIMVAKYFKKMPGPKIFGVDIWFNVHRGMLLATFILTVGSVIVIVIQESQGLQFQYKTVHFGIGITIFLLVIINPILALARPPPDGKRRMIFNFVHWGVGMSAWILAMINIALGLYMLGFNTTQPAAWLYLAFIVEHGLTDMVFTKFLNEDIKKAQRATGKGGNSDPSSGSLDITDSNSAVTSRAVTIFCYTLMGVYCASVVGYWVGLVVLLAKNT